MAEEEDQRQDSSSLNRDIDGGLNRTDEDSGDEIEDPSSSSASGRSESGGGLADRLAGILVGDGNGDLLLEESDRESGFLRWIQALDTHVAGACRADERLKPLMSVSAVSSSGVAEDRILSHLCQHFEAAEVGLLARCLCVPLVSIRVGKVTKQGKMLCPTSTRGNLNLTLLPSSDLRITFVGDHGQTERLATLNSNSECCAVVIEEIMVDKSGRSFLINAPQAEVFYFWCSEKSKPLGMELLSEMKDLLKRKPTLAELTGISETRLEWFATRLRAYLIGANVNAAQESSAASMISSPDTRSKTREPGRSAHSSTTTSAKPLRSRHPGVQSLSVLSPRPIPFKDGLTRAFSSLRGASIEKLRHHGDFRFPTVDNDAPASSLVRDHSDGIKPSDGVGSTVDFPLSFLESLEKSSSLPILSTTSQHPPTAPQISPYHCWCPASSSPSRVPRPHLAFSITEPLSLPPLSSLLPVARSTSLTAQAMSFGISDAPTLLPDPLLQLPFSKQSSQQLPTFTPLMCDPIVHIPLIDVCSSGQGYLVSAGPAIATSIAPLHSKLVSPLISESETAKEKGARETLRLLMGGSSQSTPLMDMLPAVLTSNEMIARSRGLYRGAADIDAISRSSVVGLVPFSVRSIGMGSRGLYSGTIHIDDISRSFSAGFVPFSERSASVSEVIDGGSFETSEEKCRDSMDGGCANVLDPASSGEASKEN